MLGHILEDISCHRLSIAMTAFIVLLLNLEPFSAVALCTWLCRYQQPLEGPCYAPAALPFALCLGGLRCDGASSEPGSVPRTFPVFPDFPFLHHLTGIAFFLLASRSTVV